MPIVKHCSDANRFLKDYLEGNLSLLASSTFRLHVSFCSACRRQLDEVQGAWQEMKRQGVPTDPIAPDQLVQAAREFMRDWQRPRD